MASETDRAPSARVDAKVAAIIDSRTDKDLHRGGNDDDSDNDALFDELENDETFDALRERRMQQLHEEFSQIKHSFTLSFVIGAWGGGFNSNMEFLFVHPII